MSSRRRARAIAFQVIYQNDLNPEQSLAIKDLFIQSRLSDNRKLVEFSRQLIDGVNGNRDEIDQRLSAIADNWKLSRMSATDRNVLRLGAFEILYFDTPDRVAINEAIDLSKRYGGEQSFQFVNGVLDKLIQQKQRGERGRAATDAVDRHAPAEKKPAGQRATSTHGRGLLDHRRKPADRKPIGRKPAEQKPVDRPDNKPPEPSRTPESEPEIDSIFGKRKESSIVVEVISSSDPVEKSDASKVDVVDGGAAETSDEA